MKIDPQNGLQCGVFCRVVDLPERGASRGRALTDPLSSSERCFFDIMGRVMGSGFLTVWHLAGSVPKNLTAVDKCGTEVEIHYWAEYYYYGE